MRNRAAAGRTVIDYLYDFGDCWVRGLSIGKYLASFATASGVLSLLMFLLFAAMPTLMTLVGRDRIRTIS